MLQSMTGYGQATYEGAQVQASVEVKTINSKQADVSLRLPAALAAQEMAWRRQVLAHLGRGKVAVTVTCVHRGAAVAHVDQGRFKAHYQALQALAAAVGAAPQDLFALALQGMAGGDAAAQDTAVGACLPHLERTLQAALHQCVQSRQAEGAALAKALQAHCQVLQKGLQRVEQQDPTRRQAAREKLQAALKVWRSAEQIDENRLEQELIYYLERLDIVEEKVRLGQHLAYFQEVLQAGQVAGKKLGFIAQEIGRELNTIGAKANHAPLQKTVVHMKEALENIKEQLHNVL